MSTEPEAIRLAKEGEFRAGLLRQGPPEWCAELRRLHAQSLADEELMRVAMEAMDKIVKVIGCVLEPDDHQLEAADAALSRLRQRVGE